MNKGTSLAVLALSGSLMAQEPSEALLEAVDAALASSLVDPTEVIDYEVGGLVRCSDLARRMRGQDRDCVCYALNSRNRMGGYAGKSLRFGVVGQLSDGAFMVVDAGDVEGRSGGRVCAASGMVQRDGAKIAEKAR